MSETEISETANNETVTNSGETKETPKQEVAHLYYEIGNEIGVKPQVVADIIELESPHSVIIYCNTPSDADFVDAALRKRGLVTHKLIGNVPQPKVTRAIQEIRDGTAQVVILTDIAARGVDPENFEYIVNYSVPSDPETYLNRVGDAGKNGKVKKVLNFIAPLDFTNFHYVQKFLDFPFSQANLPAAQSRSELGLKRLEKQALESPAAQDAKNDELIESILSSENKTAVIRYLLATTLEGGSRSNNNPRREEYREEPRAGRNDSRRENRGRYDDEGGQPQGDGEGRGYQRRERSEGQGRDESFRRGPRSRVVRFYVGKGGASGVTEEVLRTSLTAEGLAVPADVIKGFKIRPSYSFIDMTQEGATTYGEHLKGLIVGGDAVVVLKATEIPEPKDDEPSNEAPAQETQGGEAASQSDDTVSTETALA